MHEGKEDGPGASVDAWSIGLIDDGAISTRMRIVALERARGEREIGCVLEHPFEGWGSR
jgi:hypothetical protein